ncbi:hypothetical protein [Burkholderia cenocepacia]|uniref:hypothetical protein n=1 Tax=Burkholderia cenocepacia TaxID=95486 RepID=UPI002B2523E1|nr:hypothetical protein [Burkholderia cenocepacia]MEB2554093.1 hypothetical protein [Burkholderia cenocepacia]
MKITDDMLTEWFPVDAYTPAHEGEYEARSYAFPEVRLLKFEKGVWWFFSRGIGWLRSGHELYEDAEFRGLKEKHHG